MNISLFALMLTFYSLSQPALAKKIAPDCTFNGKPLWGKVKFVTSFPDIKIQVVDSLADLKVKGVKSFPKECGMWQEVKSHPDLKVQIVNSHSDVKVQFVESFPGLK